VPSKNVEFFFAVCVSTMVYATNIPLGIDPIDEDKSTD
jgi:hypothetical protein